ncbi:unnamed protein product [Meganyctiphanes norvegica]|uniref:Uncharacterized protein n=1 Tax=Meganyctiphanes norvegica TaxID=48144 RepID=A0AAV2S4X3_MEGNR
MGIINIPEPKTSFFFFSLRTGSLICVSASLIYAFLSAIFTTYVVTSPTFLKNLDEAAQRRGEERVIDGTFWAAISWAFAIDLCWILVSCFFIHGTRSKRPWLMWPYCYVTLASAALTVIFSFFILGIALYNKEWVHSIEILVLMPCFVAVYSYLGIVTRAYIMQVKRALGNVHTLLENESMLDV